jgi:hypothetical protein
MRRILGISGYLRASAIALLFASGCAQSEGERCQITSDCADGLTCQSIGGENEGAGLSQGNGVCKPPNSFVSTKDATVDEPAATVPVEPSIDAGFLTAPDAALAPDTTSIDTGAID